MALRVHLLHPKDLDIVYPRCEIIARAQLVDLSVRPLELVDASGHLEGDVKPDVTEHDTGVELLLHTVDGEPENAIQDSLVLLLGRLVAEVNGTSVFQEDVLVGELEHNLLLLRLALHARMRVLGYQASAREAPRLTVVGDSLVIAGAHLVEINDCTRCLELGQILVGHIGEAARRRASIEREAASKGDGISWARLAYKLWPPVSVHPYFRVLSIRAQVLAWHALHELGQNV